jgi:hypothetical protein
MVPPTASEPDDGVAVSPLTVITVQKCATGPPTAVRANVPAGGPPFAP